MMTGKELYEKWLKAWNEDVSLLEDITDEGCIVHQARTDGKSSLENKGPDALKGIIQDGLALFDDAVMSVEVGPIEENSYVSARWTFTGKFNGEMPGATAEAGTEMSFHGMDIFLIDNGKLAEYWVCSDALNLMEQMGIFDN